MAQTVAADDPRLRWAGVISLEETDAYVRPWRIVESIRPLYAEALLAPAGRPAGARLAFRTDAESLGGQIVPNDPAEGPTVLDCECDGEIVGGARVDESGAFTFEDLPPGEKAVELWLPHNRPFALESLTLPDGAALAGSADDRPKWIHYGSSISHNGSMPRPTATWPAQTARAAGLNLTCLGYGGNCHLDPLVASIIRDREADFISLKVGINIYGGATLSPRTFRGGVTSFVRIIREGHPTTPIVLISAIFGCHRERDLNPVGFTLRRMRDEVEAAAAALRACGDQHCHFFNGLELLGEADAAMLPDLLHPDEAGCGHMARNFLDKVAPRWFV